jgi:putative hydrolase of the HAD superfamily
MKMIKAIIFDLDDTLYPDKIKTIDKKKSAELIKNLSKKYMIAITSNGNAKKNSKKIDELGIRKYLKKIMLREFFINRKPLPNKINRILKELNITNKEALIIGDKIHTDILVAKLTKVKSVLVTNGQKRIQFVKPDYKINSVLDLERILTKL